MINYFQEFYDWSEAWSTLVPLSIYLIKKPKQHYLRPVYVYLCIAFLLNLFIDVLWKVKHFYPVEFKQQTPAFLLSNNFLYNIHSVCRLILLIWFFNSINFKPFKIKNIYVGISVCLLFMINFIFEPFNQFSSFTFSVESIILLTYSIAYFLFLIKSDELRTEFDAHLFVVTGIAIYEAANFFIFLFHKALTNESSEFSAAIWKLQNVYFIIFCLYVAKAFYGSSKTTLVSITST